MLPRRGGPWRRADVIQSGGSSSWFPGTDCVPGISVRATIPAFVLDWIVSSKPHRLKPQPSKWLYLEAGLLRRWGRSKRLEGVSLIQGVLYERKETRRWETSLPSPISLWTHREMATWGRSRKEPSASWGRRSHHTQPWPQTSRL